MNILVVKANNRPDGISSKMYDAFMQSVKGAENAIVTTYDVFAEDMPYIGQELFDAFGKLQNGAELIDVEKRLLAAKQKAKEAFAAADVVVIAFPLWNFTVPARLHTFIDYICEAGFTFKYGADGNLVHLLADKKVILLNARGGVYSAPEMQPMEMAVNYMRAIFANMFGMEIIDEVIIEGHNANPAQAEEIVQAGLKRVAEAGAKLVYETV
ncbi:FMN-dependent NADH-azoreductase [Bacillus sp. REN3]|uniref:FMN-dependent NADH-azoreductase n=1 Tax=Bacillus sp. REN3 TaxID=2802440 RepID=UPI001AED8A28|nr:FMN-dependent NADH-azoreductase [Bacillus sp. REN3]